MLIQLRLVFYLPPLVKTLITLSQPKAWISWSIKSWSIEQSLGQYSLVNIIVTPRLSMVTCLQIVMPAMLETKLENTTCTDIYKRRNDKHKMLHISFTQTQLILFKYYIEGVDKLRSCRPSQISVSISSTQESNQHNSYQSNWLVFS